MLDRLKILAIYLIHFTGRGFVMGAVFSTLFMAALTGLSVAVSNEGPALNTYLLIPFGTLLGMGLGAVIGLADGILVGVIASLYVESLRWLSASVAALCTLVVLILAFYLVAQPSSMFGPLTMVFAFPVITMTMGLAGITGWEIAFDMEGE